MSTDDLVSVRDSRDWTRHLRVVLAVAAGGSVLAVAFWIAASVFYGFQEAAGRSDVTVGGSLPNSRGLDVRAGTGLVPGVSVASGGELPVAIERPGPWLYTLAVLQRMPMLLTYATFFVLLYRLVRSARQPFSAVNVRRLRGLGRFLLFGALIAALVEAVAGGLLARAVLTDHRFLFDYDLPAGAVIGGIGLLAIAEVLRHGVRMREDLEGTV